jgi:hypothetical protein
MKFGDSWNFPLLNWEKTRRNPAKKRKIPGINKFQKYSGPGRVASRIPGWGRGFLKKIFLTVYTLYM